MKFPPVLNALIFIVLIIITATGIPYVKDRDIYKKVGLFEIRVYDYGLYITQPGSGRFYNFSPYDLQTYNIHTYFRDHVSKIEPRVTSIESRVAALHKQIFLTVRSYLHALDPASTFYIENQTLIYTAYTEDNKARIYASGEYLSKVKPDEKLVIGLSFNEDDQIREETDSIVITNPNFNGAIKVMKSESNFQVPTVDYTYHIINSVVEPSRAYVEIRFYDSLKEALNND